MFLIKKPLNFVAIFALLLTIALPSIALAEVRIVATVGDLAAMAREVAGPDATVDLLTRPGEDPHFVSPRPSYVQRLSRADVLVYTGLDLEVGWLPTLLTGSRNAKLQAGQPGNFDASKHVILRDVPTGRVDRSMGDVHPGGNPHFSTDPRQMARVALAFGKTLAQIDPKNADAYNERAREFAYDAIRTAQHWEEEFKKIPRSQRKFVSYHAAWSYVANWLELQDVMQIEPKPGMSPNPRHVARVLETIQDQNIKVIVQFDHDSRATTNQLAQKSGAKLLVLDGHTRENQTYKDHINQLAKKLHEALQ